MSGSESVDELVALLRAHPDASSWTGGLGETDIARAERELGTRFPPSYRRFLAELGSCEADGVEFLGVYRTPALGDALLGTVSETLDARRDPRFPAELLVVEHDGWSGLVCLDTADRDTRGEAPVVVWNPGSADAGGPERLAEDFGGYALRRCARALD